MLDFIQNSSSPILAAFLMGLLFSFDICQILTNIAALGYIFRNLTNKNRLIIRGIYFALGKIIMLLILSFTLIFLIKSGSKILHLGHYFLHYWEVIIIPALIIFGLLLLFSHKISWLKIVVSTEKFEKNIRNDNFGAFLLGALLSLAFCPTNAVLFFGVLLPLTVAVSYGFFTLLPIVFALTTALPIILIVLIMYFSIKNIEKFYKIVEKYSKIAIQFTGIVLILAGIFLLVEHLLEH